MASPKPHAWRILSPSTYSYWSSPELAHRVPCATFKWCTQQPPQQKPPNRASTCTRRPAPSAASQPSPRRPFEGEVPTLPTRHVALTAHGAVHTTWRSSLYINKKVQKMKRSKTNFKLSKSNQTSINIYNICIIVNTYIYIYVHI